MGLYRNFSNQLRTPNRATYQKNEGFRAGHVDNRVCVVGRALLPSAVPSHVERFEAWNIKFSQNFPENFKADQNVLRDRTLENILTYLT